jgi:hypothetical protein
MIRTIAILAAIAAATPALADTVDFLQREAMISALQNLNYDWGHGVHGGYPAGGYGYYNHPQYDGPGSYDDGYSANHP